MNNGLRPSMDQVQQAIQEAAAQQPTSIPIQAVDADQLPREKGWSYDEIARIVGSLYLDSHHRLSLAEEQFAAVSDEYQRKVLQTEAALQAKQEEVDRLMKEIGQLKRELEKPNGTQA